MALPVGTGTQHCTRTSSGRWVTSVAAALALAITVAIPSGGHAQAVQSVVIDMSTLSDGGMSAKTVSPLAGPGRLRIPPKGNIRSRLHVAPKKLVGPTSVPKPEPGAKPKTVSVKTARAKAKTPPPAPQPIARPTPKPKVETIATPKPKRTPPAKTAKAPAAPLKPVKAPPPIPKVTKVPPPPTAPAAPTDTTAPAQTASVPGNITLKPGRALSVLFDGTATKLPADAEAGLGALADAVRDAKDYRLQLMAYAGIKDLTTSRVRRISLSRALAVRSFLIDKGVRSTQIDVRALGNKTSEKPVNRVDVNLAQR